MQQRLVEIADTRGVVMADNTPQLDVFLSGLRTAWKMGEVRPTAQPKPQPKRGRRRPDPLATVTAELRAWFEEEPWRVGRELLDRLQVEHPGVYADGVLRTIQRRLKIWRAERAHEMVFGRLTGQEKPASAVVGVS